MALKQYRLLFDFKPEDTVELPCNQGEIVTSSSPPSSDGWIKVKSSRKGANGMNVSREGLVPFSYLVEIPGAGGDAPASTTHRRVPRPPLAPAVKHVAVEHAECAICFDDMTQRPIAVLLDGARNRTCRHFLHKSCAEELLKAGQRTCPICRAPFAGVSDLPDIESNPKRWFECVDANGDGTLSKTEVIEVLKATMAIDYRALEKNVDVLWPRWDKDGSGELDFAELCDPKVGLSVYVKAHFARVKHLPPPELSSRKLEEWFTFWDEDGNGTLEKEEILRALVKTFRISSSPAKLKELRETLDALWPVFDTDGSGEIDLKEFIQRDGLGDSLCASLAFAN